jgi:hypothetical protein
MNDPTLCLSQFKAERNTLRGYLLNSGFESYYCFRFIELSMVPLLNPAVRILFVLHLTDHLWYVVLVLAISFFLAVVTFAICEDAQLEVARSLL